MLVNPCWCVCCSVWVSSVVCLKHTQYALFLFLFIFLILFLSLIVLQMPHFPCLAPLLEAPAPLPSGPHHSRLCLWVMHMCSLAHPSLLGLSSDTNPFQTSLRGKDKVWGTFWLKQKSRVFWLQAELEPGAERVSGFHFSLCLSSAFFSVGFLLTDPSSGSTVDH